MDTSPPRLATEMLANGADWQIVTRDAVTMIDDDSVVHLQTCGLRHGPLSDVRARIG